MLQITNNNLFVKKKVILKFKIKSIDNIGFCSYPPRWIELVPHSKGIHRTVAFPGLSLAAERVSFPNNSNAEPWRSDPRELPDWLRGTGPEPEIQTGTNASADSFQPDGDGDRPGQNLQRTTVGVLGLPRTQHKQERVRLRTALQTARRNSPSPIHPDLVQLLLVSDLA